MTSTKKKALEAVFDRILRSANFTRKGTAWYRQAHGALQLLDLQKSSYGAQFYVNLCCVPNGMDVEGMPMPKEHKCPVGIRLSAAFSDRAKEIEDLLNLENQEINDAQRSEKLAVVLATLALPFFEQMRDAAALKMAIEKGAFQRGRINLKARNYLRIDEPQGKRPA